ncbi:Hypothetical protein LUCI_4420 [Lucifera butyrica]|uniref:Uncharacterized protein n=1 Tax=Lucifera butyrica TaxID=1351585 RepID=A0A498RC82_9FIRM|nr:hypothetical protein [Lucifera butyrica]VBB09134.1 Hypothetical protein LUCI_4420 [Lucifera butyrica]
MILRDLVRTLVAHRLQGVVVMLKGDEGVAGTIREIVDDLLILTNFAGTLTYVPLKKITQLRFSCTPTTAFSSTVTASTVNLGFEEIVNNHLETYRRLLTGTATGDLTGTIGIVQDASTNAANLTLQVGYQSSTITLTQSSVGNHLLISFAGLIAATTPNFSGIFHILRGVGTFAGTIGGGTFGGTSDLSGGFTGTVSGLICPASVV